jgi:hypothetical protein
MIPEKTFEKITRWNGSPVPRFVARYVVPVLPSSVSFFSLPKTPPFWPRRRGEINHLFFDNLTCRGIFYVRSLRIPF